VKMKVKFDDIDVKRTGSLLACLFFSIFIGTEFHPLIDDNPNAVNVIVTVFSILAGFLIASITFIIEPIISKSSNWRELQLLKPSIERKMIRHKYLFILYLITLGCALFMFLLPDKNSEFQKSLLNGHILMDSNLIKVHFFGKIMNFDNSEVSDALNSAFLTLVTFVFLISFTLPSSLIDSQMSRYDAVLDETKPKVLKQD
jgi:hypothetical protein